MSVEQVELTSEFLRQKEKEKNRSKVKKETGIDLEDLLWAVKRHDLFNVISVKFGVTTSQVSNVLGGRRYNIELVKFAYDLVKKRAKL